MFHVRGVADYDILLGQQEFTSESKSAGEDFFFYLCVTRCAAQFVARSRGRISLMHCIIM